MNRSFYQFHLSFRGGGKEDEKAVFAENMFKDLSFPKDETDFDPLSRYVEEKADAGMRILFLMSCIELYEERLSIGKNSHLHCIIDCLMYD